MRSTESGFNELVYLAAAQEQLTVAQYLLQSGRYVASVYLAGVAVESILLAYQTRTAAVHDAGHDLFRLAENGRFWDAMSRKQKEAITAELSDIAMRWRNNHRYRSEQAFRNWLTGSKLFRIDGPSSTTQDVVVFNAERVMDSAQRIVEVGVARW